MAIETDKELILDVNSRFYKALGTRDLELMGTVFVHDERAGCTHPGWVMLEGWEAIRQSWENVFDPEDQLDIKLHNITVDIEGDAAWVSCIQELTYIKRDPIMMNVSVSTNIFEKNESGWRMVIHQASPVPISTQEEVGDNNFQ
ncbi:MAG: nuclear transport factor 2 family protein [Candidatus Dadabacteria bacterium]|nr:nuclear transport factor 2 family protein [Candidatus Dadabacteria bacterium]